MLVAISVAFMTVQCAMPVSAEPVEVSGTMEQVSTETVSVKVAGTNTFISNHNVWDVSGDLDGSVISEPLVIIHASGEIIVLEWAVFTVTWDGQDGTLTVRNIGGMVEPGVFHIDSTIARGTGVFAGAYGWGYIDVDMRTVPPSATYDFELCWEEED